MGTNKKEIKKKKKQLQEERDKENLKQTCGGNLKEAL